MDKWKDVELEKMKVGGNRNARVFLESQPDFDDSLPISQKYDTKAAALYRDKVEKCLEFCHQLLNLLNYCRYPRWHKAKNGTKNPPRLNITLAIIVIVLTVTT